jgi:molybdenum ABC transporter molybdate-binding protein
MPLRLRPCLTLLRPKLAGRSLSRLVLVSLLLLGLLAPAGLRAQDLTVFAAASLTNALTDVCAAWARQGHPTPRLSFAASSTLARQIEQGAPANIFASADERWMDDLARHDGVAPQTRRDLLRNDLVLVVPADAPRHVTIGPGFDLVGFLGPTGRLATGDPAHVPVGIYARQALERLGVWSSVAQRIAPTDDVRAALLLVERGGRRRLPGRQPRPDHLSVRGHPVGRHPGGARAARLHGGPGGAAALCEVRLRPDHPGLVTRG